jgi:nitrate reductase alpha subunit
MQSSTVSHVAETHPLQRPMDGGHVILSKKDYSDCVVCYSVDDGFRLLTKCISSKAVIKQFMTCRVFASSSRGQAHYVESEMITFTIRPKNAEHTLSFETPEDMKPKRFNTNMTFFVDGFNWDHYPSLTERAEATLKQYAENIKRDDEAKAAARE